MHSTRSRFITADSPVSVFPENIGEQDDAVFLPDTEFLLPVTPRHTVLITRHDALPQSAEADRTIEAVVNARTAKSAAREVYCTPNYPADLLQQHLEGWWATMPLLRLLV